MRRNVATSVLPFALCLLTALAPGRALSQSASDKTAAEALFDEGKKLLGEKKFADACKRFEGSQRLDPGVGTLLFLADCYEITGRTASAWSTFREAASMAKATNQTDREQIARDRAMKLEGKLFQLTLKAPSDTPGLRVMRGDTEVKPEVLGIAVPVDPGTYELSANAPGKMAWSTKLQVPAEAGSRTIEIPALSDAPVQPPTATASAAPNVAPSQPPSTPPPGGWSTGRTAGVVVGSIGIVGIGIGAVFGGLAISTFSSVKEKCPNAACADQTVVDQSKQAGSLADISTGLFAVGGAALATGLLLIVVSPGTTTTAGLKEPGKKASIPSKTTWASPIARPGSFGLTLGTTW